MGEEGPRAPRIWLLVGEKAGDNAQSRAVAEALGWPFEVRRLVVRPRWRTLKPPVRASLHHLDPARSDPLRPPWPDLVIAIGRRLSMAALWIGRASGGRCRLVMLGRPRRLLSRFDLVVAPTHYRLPERSNVMRVDLPLLRVDPQAVARAADRWRARIAAWPRPLTAVLVGGPTRRLRLDAAVAADLLARCRALDGAERGTLFVTTSRRTPPEVVACFEQASGDALRLHRFDDPDAENPYLGLLGLADRFVVTSDSLSMMVEVARLGRPLAIHRLPERTPWWRRLWPEGRRLDAIPAWLCERGHAVRLGEPFRPPTAPPPDEVEAVAARVRGLLGLPARGGDGTVRPARPAAAPERRV